MSTDRRLGCPFKAGPACRDCNGECWEPDTDPRDADPEEMDAAEDNYAAMFGWERDQL